MHGDPVGEGREERQATSLFCMPRGTCPTVKNKFIISTVSSSAISTPRKF